VKITIGQKWRDHTALRCSLSLNLYLAILHHPGLEQSLDHPKDSLVSHPVMQKLHQPAVINVIKESFDVRLYDPIDAPALHRVTQRSQCLMAATARSKSV